MVSNAPFERATSAPMALELFAALCRAPAQFVQTSVRCQRGRFQMPELFAERLQLLAPLRQPPVQQRQMGVQLLKARFQRRLLCGPGFPRLRARFQRVQPRLHALQLLVHGVQPRFHGGLQRAYFR